MHSLKNETPFLLEILFVSSDHTHSVSYHPTFVSRENVCDTKQGGFTSALITSTPGDSLISCFPTRPSNVVTHNAVCEDCKLVTKKKKKKEPRVQYTKRLTTADWNMCLDIKIFSHKRRFKHTISYLLLFESYRDSMFCLKRSEKVIRNFHKCDLKSDYSI